MTNNAVAQQIAQQRQAIARQRQEIEKARLAPLTRAQLQRQTLAQAQARKGQFQTTKRQATRQLSSQEAGFETQVAQVRPGLAKPKYLEPQYQKAKESISKQISRLTSLIKGKQAKIAEVRARPQTERTERHLDDLRSDLQTYQAEKGGWSSGLAGSKADIVQKHLSGYTSSFAGFQGQKVQAQFQRAEAKRQFRAEAKRHAQDIKFGMAELGFAETQKEFAAIYKDLPAVVQKHIISPTKVEFRDVAPVIETGPAFGPQLPEYIPGVTGWEISAAPKQTVFSKVYGTAAHYFGKAGQRTEEIYVEPVKEFVRDVPEFVTERVVPPIVEFAKPKLEYVAKQPIISAISDMPAERLLYLPPVVGIGPVGIGPSGRDLPSTGVTVGQVIATEPRIRRFLTKAAVKGAEISYEETFGRLPPESRPGRLVSTFEEYDQIMKDVRAGKVKREDVDWSQYIIPYTPEEFGRVVGFGATVAPYVAAGPLAPVLLAGDVALAREDYQDAPEIAKKEAEKHYKDYIKTDLEEGEEHLPEKEYMDIVVPQLETEIKNQALVAMGVSGAFLGIGAAWKVGKTLKKFIPSKKFTFGGRKMSQVKYDKLMKQIEQSKLEAAKQEAVVLKVRAEREVLVPKTDIGVVGFGKQKEVIGSVEKLTMVDDLFNLKVFKTEKEAIKFVEGMTKTRIGVKRGFLEMPRLPKVPKAYITGADSFTLSSSLSTARGDKMIQFSYQLGAQGKPINVHLQLVTIPKGSKHSEILFYKAGRSSVKTIKKEGVMITREMHDPYVLVDRLVADVGKVKVGKIDETIWRMYQPNFRKVKFKKTRLSHYELLDDWVDKIPPKAELKNLFEAGKKTEKHLMIERLSPKDIEARLGLVGRRDLFGVRAEVIKPYDVTILGVGKKEAPDLIKIPRWFKEVPPKPKPTPPVAFEVIPTKIKPSQILTTKQVSVLELPPPTLIPTPPKIKIPTPKVKVTPPITKVGEGLPYMVGGTGLAISDISTLGVGVKVPVGVIDQVDLAPDKVLDIDLLPVKVGVTDWGAGLARDRIDITPRVISDIKLDVVTKPELKLKPKTVLLPSLIIKPIIRPISRVVQVPRAIQVPRLKVVQALKVAPSVAVTPAIVSRPRPVPKKPEIYPPIIKLKVPSMKRFPQKKKPLPKKGYGIEIRRKGKWEKAKIPYAFATKEGAHAIGMEKTVKEAAASYRLVKSLKPVKRTRKKPTALHKVMFRPGKEKGVMVQKKLLRITSPGEIRQISLKGAAARRGVSTLGIKKPKKVVKKKPTKKKSTKKKKSKGRKK